MGKIELNYWFVNENALSISLMHFFVRIVPKIDSNIAYGLEVIDEKRENRILYFKTLEDAMNFTEEIVSKCWKLAEVINNYNDNYLNNKTKILKRE